MSNFMNDFNIFFNMIFKSVKSLFNWFIGTTIGEIFLFTIIISIFFIILTAITQFKD